MASDSRMKSKPKKGAKQEPLKTGMRIPIMDLRVGDRIVTSWHTAAEDAAKNGKRLTNDQVMDVLREGETSRYVNRSVEVRRIDECPGQWRTHVHINKQDCYDMRGHVWIVKQ